jgi:hypothetical protein
MTTDPTTALREALETALVDPAARAFLAAPWLDVEELRAFPGLRPLGSTSRRFITVVVGGLRQGLLSLSTFEDGSTRLVLVPRSVVQLPGPVPEEIPYNGIPAGGGHNPAVRESYP